MSGVVAHSRRRVGAPLVRGDFLGGAMMTSRLAQTPQLHVKLPLYGRKEIDRGVRLHQNPFAVAFNARERVIDQTTANAASILNPSIAAPPACVGTERPSLGDKPATR
jgi:hypothetical protein